MQPNRAPSFIILVFALLLLQAFPVSGAEARNSQLSLELAYTVANFKYQEEGGDFMESEGLVQGPSARLTYLGSGGFFGELFGEYLFGDGEYNGGLQNIATGETIPYSHDGDDYDIVLTQASLGWSFTPRKVRISPYTGIGFRYLLNDSEDQYAYEREVYWTYLPFGVDVSFRPASKWVLSFRPQFNLLVTGRIESDVFEDNFDNDLGFADGYGVWGSLSIERQFGGFSEFGDFALRLTPFVRYWKMNESDSDTVVVQDFFPGVDVEVTGVEPENDTLVYGLRLGLAFPPLLGP